MAKLIIRDGASQEDRLLPAMTEGYVNVDEMRFEDLLSMASAYAGLLKYPDSANQPAGDWKAFFQADEASILASLLAANLALIEADFSRFIREPENRLASLPEGDAGLDALPAFKLARKIDSWFVQFGGLSSVAAFRAHEKIADVIANTLRGELNRLRIFLRQYHAEKFEPDFLQLSNIWHSDTDPVVEQNNARQFLKSNFYSFFNAVVFLQGCAVDILVMSLSRRNHDPAMSLYIAFLKLFKKVQGKINDFSQRHLKLYYEDILKTQRREFVPDSANLVFYPDTDGREVLIKKGTEFKAGLDENKIELFYVADNELLVNDAKVRSLHTLYFGRNKLSSPENALDAASEAGVPPRKFATSAKLTRVTGIDGNKAPANDGLKAYPLFGAPQRSKAKHLFEEARLGFAVASKALLMKQGRRDITLTFKFESREQENNLDFFIDKLSKVLLTTEPDAFFKAFRHMFNISLTGETGWLAVDEYLPLSHIVDDGCEKNCLKIQIRLPDSAEAVVPCSAGLHGELFDTDLPIVRLIVNPDAYLYPYSFLSELVISEILIEVEVRGCTDILIYNQLGQLSANAQFNPFGPLPTLGDYFIVGNYEAARKRLVAFEVDIEWSGLPQEMSGFEEYYRAYPMSFSNSGFKVSLAALKDRKWIPSRESEQPKTDLFESGDDQDNNETNKVGKKRRLSFQGLCKFTRPLENISEDQFGYDSITKDGFFKLTLANPPYAFGHKDYPLVLSKIMTSNATLKRFGVLKWFMKALPPKPLPNLPYTPLINSISINYKAVSNISLESIASAEEDLRREKIFHLHPLGLESLSPKSYGKIHLAPRCEADGNLYIGLSATTLAGQLTLFFHLREDSLPEAGAREFEFTWHYLAANQWKMLNKSQVISDTTNGFLSSGIVTLDIPPDIDKGNTILPGDLFWIRVSVNDSLMHTLCSLYGVHAQALKVSWKRQEGNSLSHLAEKLPAGSIREARFSLTGISEIRQIMSSFGGLPPESDRQRTIRISERLKHKNRAITPWDYERLILQRFPEIYKAKCFPCMTGDAGDEGRVRPGHLLIVLIPYLKEPASVNLQPMVNALVLREVSEFVKSLSSPFVKISIRNPAYEQIQVRCKVKLRRGMERGFYLKELNQEIIEYLSPWSLHGLVARFGWHIRCKDMQSHIQELDYVESVSGLSMLQIRVSDDRQYHLSDTAREHPEEEEVSEVNPAHPWSIAIPARRHLLEIVDERGAWQPVETGIAKLAIGSTFILSRENL
ncbi:MAG: hypothetical protein HY066_14055 [Betaproteobacteria bacterium]|nr:hypothetical protein [Betaproteobacteria bacterium]